VELIHLGGPTPICCGVPMSLLEANTVDAANEKHIPLVEDMGDYVKICVGNIEHPMTNEHYIAFVEVITVNGVCRKELTPGSKPVVEFCVKKADIIEVREFCNLHLLWSIKF